MNRLVVTLLGLAVSATAMAAERAAPPVVRASPLIAPCVEAAARAYRVSGVQVEVGTVADAERGDLLVGSAVEVTRALETGTALVDSDVDVARIPWVLRVPEGNPDAVLDLDDALRRDLEVVVPTGPGAHEAQRVVAGRGRVREVAGSEALRGASRALVPLSLRGPGHVIPTHVRPLEARAAVRAGSTQGVAARAFLQFLVSPDGQAAFAACR